MKPLYILYALFIIFFVLVFVSRSYAQRSPNNPIHIDMYDMETDGDSVYVDFDIILNEYRLPSTYHALFTPVVSDMSGTGGIIELPPVLIEAKLRHKLNRRMVSLRGDDGVEGTLYDRIRVGSKEVNDTIRYTYTFAYQSWMSNARLEVLVDKCGCGRSGGLEQSMVGTMPRPVSGPFQFTPDVRFIMPQKEAVKDRSESGTAYITFKVGKHDILPNFGNNAAELRKIHESIAYVKGESTVILDNVAIRAYASPEGTANDNLLLSQRRADALKGYVQNNYQIPGNIIRAEGMGENWDGLEELIKEDLHMNYRDEALRIIHEYSIEGGREATLMQLAAGAPYRYLLATHFPKLRRSDYEIKYTVPGFNLIKAKEVFQTRPGMLSLEEMFLIAQTYEKGGDEFNRVFNTAARLFPEDKVAGLNAAAASLYKGESTLASEVLERYVDDPDAWNNLGVLRIRQNRPDEAEAFLLKAKAGGNPEAEKNLEAVQELRKHIERLKPLAERKKKRR